MRFVISGHDPNIQRLNLYEGAHIATSTNIGYVHSRKVRMTREPEQCASSICLRTGMRAQSRTGADPYRRSTYEPQKEQTFSASYRLHPARVRFRRSTGPSNLRTSRNFAKATQAGLQVVKDPLVQELPTYKAYVRQLRLTTTGMASTRSPTHVCFRSKRSSKSSVAMRWYPQLKSLAHKSLASYQNVHEPRFEPCFKEAQF